MYLKPSIAEIILGISDPIPTIGQDIPVEYFEHCMLEACADNPVSSDAPCGAFAERSASRQQRSKLECTWRPVPYSETFSIGRTYTDRKE
jgi:hypothetical protein